MSNENDDYNYTYDNESNDNQGDSNSEAKSILGDSDYNNLPDITIKAKEPYFPECHKCKATKTLMVQCVNEEGISCMTCMKCLFSMIIETGVKEFCADNKEYQGMLFGYKDKFKT